MARQALGLSRRTLLFLVFVAYCACARADFFRLKAEDAAGKSVALEQFRGKVVLVVNVASECGYTDDNYKELVKLQEEFEEEGFSILAFPCNQFGAQEPGSMEDISTFAENYGINFPLFSKIDVHGPDACEVYSYLVEKTGTVPQWNFCKYLVDGEGKVRQYFSQNGAFSALRHSIQYLLNKDRSEL